MKELGPLFVHPQSAGAVWILIALIALVTIGLATLALVHGRMPVALNSSALLLLPVFAYVLGDLHVLEESKRVEFCGSCHTTMSPLVESLSLDLNNLASVHYRSGAVSHVNACYQCHSGYGIWGTVPAKAAGIRHMVRTITGGYDYPLRSHSFDIRSCLDCHAEAVPFRRVSSHRRREVQEALLSGELSCAGVCHPPAHPPEALRGDQAWIQRGEGLR